MAYRTSHVATPWPDYYEPEITAQNLRMSMRQAHEKYGIAETWLLHGLNRTTTFLVELLDAPEIGDWSFSRWSKASQRRREADRIIRALLIVVLVQANIWIAGRFILYLFNSFYALGVRLSYFLSQSLAVLLALLAVVGNLRHPLSRLVLIIAAFTTLWSYLSVPMCFSLPAVVFAGGLAEHYFPTIEVPYNSPFEPFEVISPHTPRQDIELEEL